MNIKVMYHTINGNTGKVAEAIAGALGVKAERIGEVSISEPALNYLGSPLALFFVRC